MDFSEFAKLMASVMRGGESEGEFCRTILEAIVEYPSEAFEFVHTRSSDTLRSYYNGTRRINRISREISRNLTPGKFAGWVRELSLDAQGKLASALETQLGDIPMKRFPDECAALFQDIIYEAAASGHDREPDALAVRDALTETIGALESLSSEDVRTLNKKHMNGVRVRKKAGGCGPLLIHQMELEVSQYYKFIQEQIGAQEKNDRLSFDRVAIRVRSQYLELKGKGLAQEKIYYELCDWLAKSTGCDSRVSCQVLISFFVQNCEVFDAPSK